MKPMIRTACLLLVMATCLVAGDQAGLRQLTLLELPLDRVDQWPEFARTLTAVPRVEFERRWAAIHRRPVEVGPPTLKSLELSATLDGNELRDGRAEVHWQGQVSEQGWMTFPPTSLAITGVSIPDSTSRPQWGTDSSGQLRLRVSGSEGRWTWNWLQSGEERAGQRVFDLVLPPALTAKLLLKVPEDVRISSPRALVRPSGQPAESGWKYVEILPAGETSCRVIAETVTTDVQRSLVVYRRQLSVSIREDHVRFEAVFQTEILGAGRKELVFTVPAGTELYLVSLGPDVPLAWSAEASQGARHRIRVQLPGDQSGTLRGLRLEGIVAQRPGVLVTVPQIELADAAFRSGTIQVNVTRPLQVTSIRMGGCRQESPVVAGADSETYQFQQSSTDCQISVEVRQPAPQLKSQILSLVEWDREQWAWTSDVLWTSLSGATYQLALQVPPEWEIRDVNLLGERKDARLSWELVDDSEGSSRIAIELLEALTPTTPQRIRVLARRARTERSSRLKCPVLKPLGVSTTETVLRIDGGTGQDIYLENPRAASQIDPEAIAAAWDRFPLWQALNGRSEAHPLWLRIEDNSEIPDLVVYEQPVPVRGTVDVFVDVREAVLSETFQLTVEPNDHRSVTRLLAVVTESGPDIHWQVTEPAGWNLVAQRLPSTHAPDGFVVEGGELWELRLPDSVVSRIQLRGTRSRAVTLPSPLALALLPQADRKEGTLHVELQQSGGLQVDPREMERLLDGLEKTAGVSQNSGVQSWRYQLGRSRPRLVSRRTYVEPQPCLAEMKVQSILVPFQEGSDQHHFQLRISALARPLTFRLSGRGEILTATLDDELLKLDGRTQLTLPATGLRDSVRTLDVRVRSQHEPGFFFDRRRLPQLTSPDVVWTHCDWAFAVPPEARLLVAPEGLAVDARATQESWRSRFFGPLARQASPLFVPWKSDTWTGAVATSEAAGVTNESLVDPSSPVTSHWQRLEGQSIVPPSMSEVLLVHRDRLKLLSWLLLFGVTCVISGLRMLGFPAQRRWVCPWLAGCLAAAILLPPGVADITGSLLVGSVLGLMWPRKWLWNDEFPAASEAEVPVGSTQSFTIPRPAASTIALLGALFLGADSVNALPGPIDSDKVVVIPVDAQGKPFPIVYISPSTWKALVEQTNDNADPVPVCLLQRSYCVGRQVGHDRVVIDGQFEGIVVGDAEEIVFDFPVSTVGAGATRTVTVNGQPAALRSRGNGQGFSMTWQRPARPISAINVADCEPFRIEVQWQQAIRREDDKCTLDVPVPAAAMSELHFEPANLVATTPVASERHVDTSSRQVRQVAGSHSSRFIVNWVDRRTGGDLPAARSQVWEVLDVRPGVVDVRSRSVLQARGAAVKSWKLLLPRESVIRRWSTIPGASLEPDVSAAPDGYLLQFSEPVTGPVSVDVEFATPLSPQSAPFRWSGVLWSGTDGVTSGLRERVWALCPASDFKVTPESLDESGLVPMSLEGARAGFGDLLGDRVPTSVYQATSASPVNLRITPATSSRQILLWQQTGTLIGNRLKWEVEGELEVSGLPTYSHILTVDRRLEIESISVRERGAERRLRWSESRPATGPGLTRITVFLTDPVQETQRILIQASVPVSNQQTISLPNIRLDDATVSGGRVLLRTPPGQDLALSSLRGLRELSNGNAGAPPSGETIRVFDQTDADWRASVRILSGVDTRRVTSVILLSSEDAESLSFQAIWKIPAARLREPCTVVVPAPWDLSSDSMARGAALDVIRGSDGSWKVTANPLTAEGDVLLSLRGQLQRAALAGSQLMLPAAEGDWSAGVTTYIAEMTRLPQPPLLDASSLGVGEMPRDWGTGQWQEPALVDTERLKWLMAPPAGQGLPLAPSASVASKTAVPWVEHWIWEQRDGALVGFSHLLLAEPSEMVSLQLSPDMAFQAALVRGRVAATRVTPLDQVQIAASDGVPFGELDCYWVLRRDRTSGPLTPEEIEWPTIVNSVSGQVAVTLVPWGDHWLTSPRGEMGGNWVDHGLLRLEILGDRLQERPSTQDSEPESDFLEGALQFADLLGRHPDALGPQNSEYRTRWSGIVARVNRLQQRIDPSRTALPFEGRLSSSVLANPAVSYGVMSESTSTVPVVRVNLRWSAGLAAILLLAALWPLLAFLGRPAWRSWWLQRPEVSLVAFGVLWWLFLAPSLLGFALLVLGLYQWWNARKKPTELPSAAAV